MTDYGRRIEFGTSFAPAAADYENNLRVTRVADREGLDFVAIQDHPYQRRFMDTWTLISVLAARTESVRFAPDVASLPLRPPAMLAKAVATLDLITGGRVELGLGAGAFWDAIEAMGGPRRSPGQAVAATREAIDILRLVWSGERGLRYGGSHYRLNGVHGGPRPAHNVEIWLGAARPKMLELVGRAADGWIPSSSWAGPDRLSEFHERIDAGAAAAGRPPSAIRRAYNVMGRIGANEDSPFEGPPDKWVETVTSLVIDGGMDTFIFWPATDTEAQVQTFANEIVPRVEAAVERARHPSRAEVAGK